jgi:uncharacterized protein YcbK (DUF882 family)
MFSDLQRFLNDSARGSTNESACYNINTSGNTSIKEKVGKGVSAQELTKLKEEIESMKNKHEKEMMRIKEKLTKEAALKEKYYKEMRIAKRNSSAS